MHMGGSCSYSRHLTEHKVPRRSNPQQAVAKHSGVSSTKAHTHKHEGVSDPANLVHQPLSQLLDIRAGFGNVASAMMRVTVRIMVIVV